VILIPAPLAPPVLVPVLNRFWLFTHHADAARCCRRGDRVSLIFVERSQIAKAALNARLPTINLFSSFPKLGGLMAYGPDFPSIFAQAAKYVGRVLAGANPGELPIQRPTKFDW
jgi:hypothetical protein